MGKKVGEGESLVLFGDRAMATLRDSLATFAPDLVGAGPPLPVKEAKPTKKVAKTETQTRRGDQFVREAKVQQPHDDDGSSVSSTRQRERKGTGFSVHELRAKQDEDLESVLPVDPETDIPSEYCHDDCDERIPSEYASPDENFNVNDLLENGGEELYVEAADGHKLTAEYDTSVAEMLREEAMLNGYRNGLAGNAEAIDTRGFSNELHYWDERYRYDADLRVNEDNALERQHRSDSERITNDSRRRAQDDLDRARMDADRRYQDDLNRRR